MPVPNATFADTLARVLGRPSIVPLPGLAVRALFGEMGRTLLLGGARVLPHRAEQAGFEFLYPALEESLRHQLGRHDDPEEASGR
jgi:NAD dependent epimerase/dehydratase family enzyme